MKSILIFGLLALLSCNPHSTIYMVRHAEKADGSRDPDLNEAGKHRAARLADLLKNKKIKKIYTTTYKRTIQTGTPLATMKNIKLITYNGDSLNTFAVELLKTNKNALVVGHSNTTISLLDALGAEHKLKKIEDSDYGNLFKITMHGKKKILEELRY